MKREEKADKLEKEFLKEEKKEKLKVMINESGSAKGVLEVQENNNFGFLRCDNYLTSENDIFVSPSQIRRFNLRTGDEVQLIIINPTFDILIFYYLYIHKKFYLNMYLYILYLNIA